MATKELSKNKDVQQEVLFLLSLDRDAISTEFCIEENGLEVITLDNVSEGDD